MSKKIKRIYISIISVCFLGIVGAFVIILLTSFKRGKHLMAEETLQELYANEASDFLEIDEVKVHFRVEGNVDAKPLVLVHGLTASLHAWDYWVEDLKKDYKVIRLDLPGFGLSEPPTTKQLDQGMAFYSEFLLDFMEELDLDCINLAGSSLGGWVVWDFALKYSNKVDKLGLISAAGFVNAETQPAGVKLLQFPIMERLKNSGLPPWMVKQFLTKKAFFDYEKIPLEFQTRNYHLFNRPTNLDFLFTLGKTQEFPDPSLVSILPHEILIMWGEKDRVLPVEHAYKFKELLPESELVVIPGIGHLPCQEAPSLSVKLFSNFLES